jgi:hypothetical protein
VRPYPADCDQVAKLAELPHPAGNAATGLMGSPLELVKWALAWTRQLPFMPDRIFNNRDRALEADELRLRLF